MWVFLASSHDWASSSSTPLQDSSLIHQEHIIAAAGASVQQQQLWRHASKQQNAQLGFPDSLPSSQEAALLEFHAVKQKLAKPIQLGFLDTEPEKLGFVRPSAEQVRSHMNLRRLASGAPASSSTAAQVSPSIVVIIIVLTVIFFLSAFLHLLIRWLARNPALIRRGARAAARSNNRIIALTALQGQLQQLFSIQDAGLERSLIEELPVFSYKAAMGGLKEGADCAICLCEFVGDDQLRLLPLCGHAFHTECIDTWLLSHSTCPLCRALLVPECWIPGMLPLLSSEISTTTGEAEQPLVADAAIVSAVSGGFTGSSRRSSLGHITVIASTIASSPHERNQPQLSVEYPLHGLNPRIPAGNRTDPVFSDDTNSVNRASSEANAGMGMASSGIEGTSSAYNAKLLNNSSSSTLAAMMDSGRLSYTSLGNQTDAQSEAYIDFDGVSAYGSAHRVSVHLGKCRMVRTEQQGKSSFRKSKAASADTSRRSYSKGSYEYVIDSASNLEVIIPPATSLNPHSKRLNDLLNLSRRNMAVSTAEIAANATHGPRDSVSKILSPSWASASFRKFRLCDGEADVGMSTEAIDAPLNTSLPSDKTAGIEHWPVVITPDFPESSAGTSMRANVGSDASLSPEMVNGRLADITASRNIAAVVEHETSKRAVSFRLPTPASQHAATWSARLQASASRRALSESEAFSHWEPTYMTQHDLDNANDDHNLVLADNTSSHRSSSFAKRTIDWLVGWQRRMVHPDKSAQANTSCNYPS